MKNGKRDADELAEFFFESKRILDEAFAKAKVSATNPPASQTPDSKKMSIRFSGNRLGTCLKLISCAGEMLFKGKTNLTIRKK